MGITIEVRNGVPTKMGSSSRSITARARAVGEPHCHYAPGCCSHFGPFYQDKRCDEAIIAVIM